MSNLEQFPFDTGFEDGLLARLTREIKFLTENLPLVKVAYFQSEINQKMFELVKKYYATYTENMTLEILKNEITKFFEYGKKPNDSDEAYKQKYEFYLDSADKLFSVDLSTGEQYHHDQVVDFAKRKELERVILEAASRMTKGESLDPIVKDIVEVQKIGAESDEVEGIGMIEILGKKIEEPTYLIKPFMEPGEKGYLAAKYKIGKTFLEMQMAICLAKGMPFLGFEIPEARKVLYIRFELTDYKFQQRLHKMSRYEYQLPIKKEPWFILRKGFNLISQGDQDWLFRQIDKHEPDLLIFDPLYKLTNLNLADPKSAPPLLGAYAKIQQKYPKLAINLAHHMVKSGDDDSWDSTYGPMQFFADMDYEMRLRKDGKGRFILDFLSNAESVDKIELERDPDNLIYRVVNESPGQRKDRLDDEKLLQMSEILKREYEKHRKPLTQSSFRGFCKEELGIGKELFLRLSEEGEGRFWEVEKKGKFTFYSPFKIGNNG